MHINMSYQMTGVGDVFQTICASLCDTIVVVVFHQYQGF